MGALRRLSVERRSSRDVLCEMGGKAHHQMEWFFATTEDSVRTYIHHGAAFAPDRGESVETLIKNPPPGTPGPPVLPPQDGLLALDRSKFAASFAADVYPALAAFMADSQVPWRVQALAGMVNEPAWKSKPSWPFFRNLQPGRQPELDSATSYFQVLGSP